MKSLFLESSIYIIGSAEPTLGKVGSCQQPRPRPRPVISSSVLHLSLLQLAPGAGVSELRPKWKWAAKRAPLW